MKLRILIKIGLMVSIFGFFNFNTSLAVARALPEFTQSDGTQWINSKPLTLADLKGSVVLIDVWTFECWNCYRSFPWLTNLEKRYSDKGLKIMGIHTPEFARERIISSIKEKANDFNLHHAIMVDNDKAYWRALNNRYWPAFYIIDKKGIIRDVVIGETHDGDRNARRIEAKIQVLLQE